MYTSLDVCSLIIVHLMAFQRRLYKLSRGAEKQLFGKTLFSYRLTLQNTTFVTPSVVADKKTTKSKLNLLHPHLSGRVDKQVQRSNTTQNQEIKVSLLV